MMQLVDEQIVTPRRSATSTAKNRPRLRSFQIKTQTHGCCWAQFLYQILTKRERRASFHSDKCP